MSFTAMMQEPGVTLLPCSPRKRPFSAVDDPDTLTPGRAHALPSIEQQDTFPTPPLTMSSSEESPLQGIVDRHHSPALSSSALSSIAPSAIDGMQDDTDRPASNAAPPAKRKKLTVIEKEAQRKEKEAKDKEKAERKAKKEEEKAAKDEEKRIKDEEKRSKNEEKEGKKRERDLEKQRKEADKQRVEEAKAKKERSQLRLGAFLSKPQTSKAESPLTSTPRFEEGRRKSLSLEPFQQSQSPSNPESSVKINSTTKAPHKSDYNSYFLPFALPSHATTAQLCLDSYDAEGVARTQEAFDESLRLARGTSQAQEIQQMFKPLHRGLWQPRVPEVVSSLQGSSQNPVDLTDVTGTVERFRTEDLFDAVIMRTLHFAEDVRPPYTGSYTKITSPRDTARLSRNPFSRRRQDTDYDYDSEAEWEEPEEGEEIHSDGEEDAESEASADDLEGFLDDEDSADMARQRRGMVTNELEPVSTGLCWEDQRGRLVLQDAVEDLKDTRLEWLMELPNRSINPFSTTYWEMESSPPTVSMQPMGYPLSQAKDGSMRPPKLPLQPRASNSTDGTIVGAASGMKGPIMAVAKLKAAKPSPPQLSTEDIEEFKEAVQGSNLGKAELLKALKLRFPNKKNDVIKATLESHFASAGRGADKRWIFIST